RHAVPSHQRNGRPSRVTLALKKNPTESQLITMGVAGMPLNRDDVTAV
ncbi:MAG: hypothetical protein JWR48_3056, partial [Mycobacterium sp.]|nr:hypothetical protein [Mycobacterium sp.]